MADDSDIVEELNEDFIESHGAGPGPVPEPDEGPRVFASEDDDETTGKEPAEAEPEGREVFEARLQEKERQAHGLTVALRQIREENRILHGRLAMLLERAMQAQAPAEEEPEGEGEPDPEADAVGAIRHDVRKVGEEVARRIDAIEDRERAKEIDQGVGETIGWVQADAAAYTEQAPDYPEAAEFVAERMRTSITARLRFENPGADEERVAQVAEGIFARDLANLHLRYARSNTSFAHAVYSAAKAMGFGEAGARRAASRAAAPAQDPPELEAARRRVAASRNLNGNGGASPRRPLSKRDLVSMSDEQFAELMDSGKLDFKGLAASFGVQE